MCQFNITLLSCFAYGRSWVKFSFARPQEWHSGLRHCAVLAVLLQTLVRNQAVSQPAVTGRPMSQHTIGPASSGLEEGLVGWDVLVSSPSSTVARYTAFPPTYWLASGLSGHCVKKQCGLAGLCFGGRMALDLLLSRVRKGVALMGQDCNYQLDKTNLWR